VAEAVSKPIGFGGCRRPYTAKLRSAKEQTDNFGPSLEVRLAFGSSCERFGGKSPRDKIKESTGPAVKKPSESKDAQQAAQAEPADASEWIQDQLDEAAEDPREVESVIEENRDELKRLLDIDQKVDEKSAVIKKDLEIGILELPQEDTMSGGAEL